MRKGSKVVGIRMYEGYVVFLGCVDGVERAELLCGGARRTKTPARGGKRLRDCGRTTTSPSIHPSIHRSINPLMHRLIHPSIHPSIAIHPSIHPHFRVLCSSMDAHPLNLYSGYRARGHYSLVRSRDEPDRPDRATYQVYSV